jgi:hypothetical protein
MAALLCCQVIAACRHYAITLGRILQQRVIRDWADTSNASRHVGYVPGSGSEIRVLPFATMGLVS